MAMIRQVHILATEGGIEVEIRFLRIGPPSKLRTPCAAVRLTTSVHNATKNGLCRSVLHPQRSCNVLSPPVGRGSTMPKKTLFCALALISLVGALVASGCSNGKSSAPNGGAFVNIRVSDPATCSGPNGAFSHIYVTITDVQINASGSAGNGR